MQKKYLLGSLIGLLGILGIWQLAANAQTWSGPKPGCYDPSQTDCNVDGVIWNRKNFDTAPSQQGNYKIDGRAQLGSDLRVGGDVYFTNDLKAFRVDKVGSNSTLNIGNWGNALNAEKPVDVNILGNLNLIDNGNGFTDPTLTTPKICLSGDCRTTWPAGGGGGGGTVTSVGSGNGLTGGPIVGAGALAIISCGEGKILKTVGGVWACADDATGPGGTLTDVLAGSGISVTGLGNTRTVAISSAGCAPGNIMKWDGASWSCQADNNNITSVVGSGGITVANGAGPVPNVSLNTGVTDARYVLKSGDTMSGGLSVQGSLDGQLTSRFGFSGAYGDYLLNVQPAANTIFTKGTISHSGAINTSGNILITGASKITSPQYCIGASCINSWPVASTGDVTDVFGGSGITVTNPGGPQPTVKISNCPNHGQVMMWDSLSSAWACAIPVENVQAGAGLTGGGGPNASGIVTVGLDTGLTDTNYVNTSGDTMTGNLNISTNNLSFGATTRQMMNLWGTIYGIGVQSDTQYYRSNLNFAWYKGGTHGNAALDAGGGTELMSLRNGDLVANSNKWGTNRLTLAECANILRNPAGGPTQCAVGQYLIGINTNAAGTTINSIYCCPL